MTKPQVGKIYKLVVDELTIYDFGFKYHFKKNDVVTVLNIYGVYYPDIEVFTNDLKFFISFGVSNQKRFFLDYFEEIKTDEI